MAWIVWSAAAGIVAMTTSNPFYLVVLIAAAAVVHSSHRRPGPSSRSFRIFLLGGLGAIVLRTALVVFGTVDAENAAAAALEGSRLAALLVVFGTFNSVADPFGVLRLAPRRLHEPALAAALALSIAPRTIAAVARVRQAQELRGIRIGRLRSLTALAVPVLETGMEEAMTLAESMDSRGHGRGRRSRYRPERWEVASGATAIVSGVCTVAFAAALLAGRGGLAPSTFPLRWPDVSPLLVVAAAGFALPGFLPAGRAA
ncbi:MAG: hypothetical protein HY240_02505 [Actinobacteria bacterium]|nr:hypothetical protein [Actinomycetota bacterium]